MSAPIRDALADFATRLDAIAATARTLATEPDDPPSTRPDYARRPLDAIAEELLHHRHARADFFPASLFHEPAWEILLSLFVAQRRGRTLNVRHLVHEVDAPVTTSQRWVDTLAHMKLIRRVPDANDRRRIELSLSEPAMRAMERYLTWMAEQDRPAAADHARPLDGAA